MLRWELATAVAGAVLGINPFDQPNVQAAKDLTSRRSRRTCVTAVCPPAEPRRRSRPRRCAARRDAARSYVATRPISTPDPRRRARCERRARSATARPRRRSATARATCTRPASCTRAARRSACSCSSSDEQHRGRDPRPAVRLRGARARAGDRRRAGAALARAAVPADRAGPAERVRRDRRARRGARVSTAQAPVTTPANPFAQDVDERLPTAVDARPVRRHGRPRRAQAAASRLRPARPTAGCPSASACSRSCAEARTRRPSAPTCAPRSTRTLAVRSTSGCGRRSSRASASSPATSTTPELFDALGERLDELDRERRRPGQRLFYLAIAARRSSR